MCAMKPDSLQPRKNGPAFSSSPLVTSSRCFQSNSCGLSWTSSQIRAEKMNSDENPAERFQPAWQADSAHRALLCPHGSQGRGKAGTDPWAKKGSAPWGCGLQLACVKWSWNCQISHLLLFGNTFIKIFLQVILHVKCTRRNSPWGCRISKRHLNICFGFFSSNKCSRKEWLFKNYYFFWHRTRTSQRIFRTSSVKYLQ